MEPFCGHLSSKNDKVSEELTLRYSHEEPCVDQQATLNSNYMSGMTSHHSNDMDGITISPRNDMDGMTSHHPNHTDGIISNHSNHVNRITGDAGGGVGDQLGVTSDY